MRPGTIPEPRDALESRSRGSMVLPPPKGKSPAKTHLNSPARRNPSLGPTSSPVRGSIVEPRSVSAHPDVRRLLEFSKGDTSISPIASMGKNRGSSAKPQLGVGKLGKTPIIAPAKRPFQAAPVEEDEEEELPDQVQGEDSAIQAALEESYHVNGFDDDDVPVEEEFEEDPTLTGKKPSAKATQRGKAKAKAAELDVVEEPVAKKGRGRPSKKDAVADEVETAGPPRKKRKSDVAVFSAPSTKTTTTRTAAPAKTKPGRKRAALATIDENADSPQVQRGPPLPRHNGLASIRRETPGVGAASYRTKSGRNSIKPLQPWRGEKIEYDEEVVGEGKDRFMIRKVADVIRIDEPVPRMPQKWKAKSKSTKKLSVEPEEEPAEPWELDPGKVYGDVVVWDPEDPAGSHGEEREDEIALSYAAINTRPVADATFQFAKTLTLPFFGSGVVDLPPGSIKRTKNSRKMQMAFFVFTGRVKAIVNGIEFRISKGGMFQVPRGEFISQSTQKSN